MCKLSRKMNRTKKKAEPKVNKINMDSVPEEFQVVVVGETDWVGFNIQKQFYNEKSVALGTEESEATVQLVGSFLGFDNFEQFRDEMVEGLSINHFQLLAHQLTKLIIGTDSFKAGLMVGHNTIFIAVGQSFNDVNDRPHYWLRVVGTSNVKETAGDQHFWSSIAPAALFFRRDSVNSRIHPKSKFYLR